MDKMKSGRIVLALCAALFSGASLAQLALPVGSIPRVDLPKIPVSQSDIDLLSPEQLGRVLEQARVDRLSRFVRQNRKVIELDENRNPVVRGELIASGVDDTSIAAAQQQGFKVLSRDSIEGLDLAYVRFGLPDKMSLNDAKTKLWAIMPDADIDADHIYFQSSATSFLAFSNTAAASKSLSASLGVIDGGVADHPSVRGRIEQNGFAKGAPFASSHGTAVAALMIGSGEVKGARSGANLLAADVYGTDKAGGNASAIARALGWLAGRGVSVVTISLVGPNNTLLKNAIAAAQRKGIIIVAAVGNDGPAAPPAYPAAYLGVISVTGVDSRNRALPEAGSGAHTDFAAPGADIFSALSAKKRDKVRGTSFAAPLVAARLSVFYPRQSISAVEGAVLKLTAEAIDLGKKGRDPIYGEGLVCGNCAR